MTQATIILSLLKDSPMTLTENRPILSAAQM